MERSQRGFGFAASFAGDGVSWRLFCFVFAKGSWGGEKGGIEMFVVIVSNSVRTSKF